MESTQNEILTVLLESLKKRGLVSELTCSRAVNLVHSVIDIPELLRYPVCLTEEECKRECT